MSVGPILPTSVDFSEEHNQFIIQLTDVYSNIAYAVNNRQVSFFNLTESIASQYFTNAGTNRPSYRQCFLIGAISAGSTQVFSPTSTTPTPTGVTLFVHMYGGILTDVPDFRPLPYVDVANVTNQVSVTVTQNTSTLQTTITVTNGSTAPAITNGYLILEYLKN